MKIDDASTKPAASTLPALQAQAQAQAKPAAKTATTANASNIVSISATTRALSATPLEEAPFNAARVDKIRAAIAAGSFTVNPDNIADGLIASVRELLGEKK